MRTLEAWAIEMEISAWSADGLFSREVVEFIEAIQREAIEAAAKVADEIDKGIYKPGTIATAIRALLPPAPPSREDK